MDGPPRVVNSFERVCPLARRMLSSTVVILVSLESPCADEVMFFS
jgi:hypothetical protein